MALVVASALAAGCGVVNTVTGRSHTYTAESSSMEPTLHKGQRFEARTVSGGAYSPKRGDVVVFTMPSWTNGSSTPMVKRVIAIGGDSVFCCRAGGELTLNGALLQEPYIKSGELPSMQPFSVVVPAGRLWVMGDYRQISADSRHHLDLDSGTIPASSVVGVAVLK